MSQDFSVLLHTPTDGTDGDCTASLKNPRGIEPRRILPQPRGSQAHTCMSPQSSDCLTFIHNLKPSDPSIFFRTPQSFLSSDIKSSALCNPRYISALWPLLQATNSKNIANFAIKVLWKLCNLMILQNALLSTGKCKISYLTKENIFRRIKI